MKANQLALVLSGVLPSIDLQYKGDANETLAFARQLEKVYSKTYDVKYPDLKGRMLLPMSSEVPSGAKAHTYRQLDQMGEAKIVDDTADDFPNVELAGKEFTAPIVSLGDSYRYTIQDLRYAAMLGMDLESMKARAARRVMEMKLDKLIALGDSDTGILGIARHSAIATAPTGAGNFVGSWSAATADAVQADIDFALSKINNDSLGVHEVNALVVPVSLYNTLRTKYFTAGGFRRSVLEEVLTRNSQLRIMPWARLETASGTNGKRILFGQFDQDTAWGSIPQEFEQLPPQAKGMALVVNCHMRFGGVVVPYPKAFIYADNA